ncbi:hypothetical protein O181_011836 [Austropuccinia psidii MF-1]|uniref:40S ribosomal protein S18 n=1 Tax=Austropuccinia psidii MF-1 TaxID=1389203 RepID=A0A9Q3GLQ1_9BASI|nr:hypothetical protein [Austropuccinia psidii MF-1]
MLKLRETTLINKLLEGIFVALVLLTPKPSMGRWPGRRGGAKIGLAQSPAQIPKHCLKSRRHRPSTTSIHHPSELVIMSLVVPEAHQQFQHILRLLNTNVDGRIKIMFALTQIRGVGRRLANVACKKADVDLNKRAGELNPDELERIVTIIQNPAQFKIPAWFLNRQRDIVDGKSTQVLSNGLDSKLREDLERLKKIRAHRGLRHYWGLRVRGQHTKTTGRRGKTVGVSKKRG